MLDLESLARASVESLEQRLRELQSVDCSHLSTHAHRVHLFEVARIERAIKRRSPHRTKIKLPETSLLHRR
jgi:hypothetical protein